MRKRKRIFVVPGQSGLTLLEVMVSSGLVGICFLALMSIFGQVGRFTSFFHGQAATIEGVSEAVANFNAVLSQATLIKTCNCQANTSSRANCIWDSTNPWYDPVKDGGAASPATILSGEFEAFSYEGNTWNYQQPGGGLALLDNNVSGMAPGSCVAQRSDLPASKQRGCKLSFSLKYYAPTRVSGSTPGKAGGLKLEMDGGARNYSIGLGAAFAQDINGSGGVGINTLSCGFEYNTSPSSSVFVLDLKLKVKANSITNASSASYDPWHPADEALAAYSASRGKGIVREVRQKFSLRNISARGSYFWRGVSLRGCKQVGQTASSAVQCCSQAITGTACIACKAGGVAAGSAAECCSGSSSGGFCI